MNCHISAQKHLLLKPGYTSEKAIFNVSVCQVSLTKIIHMSSFTLFKQVYKTSFCSD